jgi:hypothetical protein
MSASVPRAFRIILSFNGDDFKLDSATRIEKVLPASAPPPDPQGEGESGSWFTVEDKQGRTLYRRPLNNLFEEPETDADDQRGLSRAGKAPTTGVISLLVPELPGAHTFSIHSSHSAGKRGFGAARPLMKLPLRELAAMAAKTSSQGGDHGRR